MAAPSARNRRLQRKFFQGKAIFFRVQLIRILSRDFRRRDLPLQFAQPLAQQLFLDGADIIRSYLFSFA